MVGVPRSTGCHLCVKRRVKCDQKKPVCDRCVKYGADCPGYERGFKFVAGKHAVRPRQKEQDSGPPMLSPASPSSPPPSSSAASSRSNGLWASGASTEDLVPWGSRPAHRSPSHTISSRDSPPKIRSLSLYTPRESRQHIIGGIIQSLRATSQSSEIAIFDTWFSTEVPAHLGAKITLDSAMATLSLHILGKVNNDQGLLGESRRVYGQSLMALQRALNHPTEWKTSETLGAAMILSNFELFAGTSHPDSWMKHATGVSWLIQQRGPEAYRAPFDRLMLLSIRPIIVMDCLFNLKDCFLAKPSWQKVILDGGEYGLPVQAGLEKLVDRYFIDLAKVPSILKYAWRMRDGMRHGMPLDLAKVPLLMQHTLKLLDDVSNWFMAFNRHVKPPVEVPSKDPGSLFETVLDFGNPWLGSMYMGYWATASILQECLKICGYPIDYSQTSGEYARNILRSVETVSVGIMGPYRVGYAVRIAYEFVNTPTQVWVLSTLAKFQESYAATSPELYEKPGQNPYHEH